MWKLKIHWVDPGAAVKYHALILKNGDRTELEILPAICGLLADWQLYSIDKKKVTCGHCLNKMKYDFLKCFQCNSRLLISENHIEINGKYYLPFYSVNIPVGVPSRKSYLGKMRRVCPECFLEFPYYRFYWMG